MTGVKTVSLVGASLGGGAAAQALMQAQPDEIDRLVLLAGSHAGFATRETEGSEAIHRRP